MKSVDELGPDPIAIVRDDCAEIIRRLSDQAQRLSGKTIAITGAAGMLPAYFVDTLAMLNDTRVLDHPVRLLPVVRKRDANAGRLLHLAGRPDVRFIVADAATTYALDERVDMFIHAASPASPAAYLADPLGTLAVNGAGTRHVLDLACRDGAESVLYVSTSEVYGTPGVADIPTPETFVGTTPWLGGRACYVEGKRFGEALCAAAAEQHAVPVKIARPFHVHGPGQALADSRIVATLIRMGLENEPFVLKSDGRATRTYGYVIDAVHAMFAILLSAENGEAFNVGADRPETTIRELAEIVAGLFGRPGTVRANADPAAVELSGAPMRVQPDLRKLRERLGIVPSVPLEQGLARTIQWHRSRLERRGTS